MCTSTAIVRLILGVGLKNSRQIQITLKTRNAKVFVLALRIAARVRTSSVAFAIVRIGWLPLRMYRKQDKRWINLRKPTIDWQGLLLSERNA